MLKKTKKKPKKTIRAKKVRRRVGRPSRAEASNKALTAIDPAGVDPRDVLRAIAADTSAPAAARVTACKLLMGKGDGAADPVDDKALDEVSRRALAMMARGRMN